MNKDMMRFCPNCHSLLMLEPATDDDVIKFYCITCPYVHRIQETIEENVLLVKNPPTSAKKFTPGGCSDLCMKEHVEHERADAQYYENERERRVEEEKDKAYSEAFSLFMKEGGGFSTSEAMGLEEASMMWQTMTDVQKNAWLNRVASNKAKGKAPANEVVNISDDDDED